jgi:hypothetical protein
MPGTVVLDPCLRFAEFTPIYFLFLVTTFPFIMTVLLFSSNKWYTTSAIV